MSGVEEDATATERHAAFRALVNARYSCKEFQETPVPAPTVSALLDLTQRAPTSFNSQPYRLILVQDAAVRKQLAGAMTGMNGPAVAAAPVVAVFCADTEVTRESHRLVAMMGQNPAVPKFYLAVIPK